MIERHRELPSTNDRAKELAKAGAPHGQCVIAETQSAGRGRRGRSWNSPPGAGIYASFILRPKIAPKDAGLISIGCAVALAEAILDLSTAPIGVKWPNDILATTAAGELAGRKVAGVLVELDADQTAIRFVIAGFGVNLREVERPPEVGAIATSLEALCGHAPGAEALLADLSERIEEMLAVLESGATGDLIRRWTALAIGLGQTVVLRNDGAELSGKQLGLAPDGALVLETAEGVRRIYAGDLALTDR